MAARRRKRGETLNSPIEVRRRAGGEAASGLRKLPPDLEDLAAGRRDTPWRQRRTPRGRIADQRVAGLIPGVANHEARRVYDAHVERLRRAVADGAEAQLERGLSAVWLLALWRARNVTGFEAFAQDVVGLDHVRATALAERGARARSAALEPLPDLAAALWLRCEAALLDRCPEAHLEVQVTGEQLSLAVSLPLAPKMRAADALSALSRATGGLARILIGDDSPRPPPGRGR